MVRTKEDVRKGTGGKPPLKEPRKEPIVRPKAPKTRGGKTVFIVTYSETNKGYENAMNEPRGVFGTRAKAAAAAIRVMEKELSYSLKECREIGGNVDIRDDGSVHVDRGHCSRCVTVTEHTIQ